ncbi:MULTISPECIES: sugar ABC transporter ATP-binding protein [unclassified Streptomyces]|uniref:sugar ABC transporter ATP-binding protein n=1 Tax=unclassified Streptomyces TaxID=2593676 RepID=UPI0006F4F09B|nr:MULTISPECIES: sugar ABC transporter ATP-binding protein [unclassified Streptomyces]KQX49921.1 sugar ABC transporter ATP-binding protein [Streptomyces sp. Root1304]KRA80036.1 sugar ABC transporter ATP-binding protein [Streptomyces sp. Root66D1]
MAAPPTPRTPTRTDRPVLEARGIRRAFPGVLALDGVDLRLFPGEVHALMGENGAGKSTLIKVLTGVHPPDAGTVTVDGADRRFSEPLEAQHAGISTVYQEVNLCPNLSVAENILIGREPRRLGLVHWSALHRRAERLITELELDLDVRAPLSAHSIAVQQLVAIVRAVDVRAKVLVLDEPTSSLDRDEVAQLFTLVRRLRDRGVAILFVTHFLDQVFDLCDRVTVLRNGRLEGEYRIDELTPVTLVHRMVGGELRSLDALAETSQSGTATDHPADVPFLSARGLGRTGSVEPYDLDIHRGEVIGLAGLLGSGRTEAVRLLFGADHADEGELRIDGEHTVLRSPRTAIAHKIAFCSENRKAEGLIGELTVRENIVLALQAARGWTRPLSRARQDEIAARWIEVLDIRPAAPEAQVRNLSGGNQQKVLLARWLLTDPDLLILDEPTRGIDIGAKTEIQRLVTRLAAEGTAVLYISAELDEVLRLSHRVGVLRDRRLVATLPNDTTLTPDRILGAIATGATS